MVRSAHAQLSLTVARVGWSATPAAHLGTPMRCVKESSGNVGAPRNERRKRMESLCKPCHVQATREYRSRKAALGRAPSALLRPRLDCGEGSARNCFAAVADVPPGFDAAVDVDEKPERFSAAPPAEARACDDPGVLVEPVALVGRGRFAVGCQPGVEASCTDGEGDLVERLRGSTGHVEGRGAGRPKSLGADGAPRTGTSTRASAEARRPSGVALTSRARLRRSRLRLARPARGRLERPVGRRLWRELPHSFRVRRAAVRPSPDSSPPGERGGEREDGQEPATADMARHGSQSPARNATRPHRPRRQRWGRLLRLMYTRRPPHRLARVAQLCTRPFGEFRIDQR
jgi:hypothetical protein